jgi:N-methylhydantoinase A
VSDLITTQGFGQILHLARSQTPGPLAGCTRGFPVTISSAVLPEFREYERTLTACMNSYVRPQVASYVDRLQDALSDLGVKTQVDILRSDAGVMTPAEAARNPVYGVLSGPSGGVAGALYVAARAGFPNVLTFDMGGTSTDVSLCRAGEPTIGRETTIGQFRIKVPSVDVHTVGAGGGSIAHVPQLTGALRVGPQSAGAEPGPPAYGQGGSEPTVTDANGAFWAASRGSGRPRSCGGWTGRKRCCRRSATRSRSSRGTC